jgi:signal peptidase I
VLLWSGRAYGLFKWILVVNQVAGLALILVLWLGDGLGSLKLDIAGVMLLLNLLCGGPLMAIWGGAMLPALRRGNRLFHWFNPRLA